MSNSNHKPQASSPAVEVEEFLKTLDTFAEPVAESLPAGPQAPERPALPFQPDEDAGPLNQALERNFAKLLEYHYTAHTSVWESLAPFPEGAFRTSVKGLMSAQLYAFRDADRLRFDYPVLLPENSADHWRLSLREVVDGLLEALADKEEASHLKRALLRVERHIKLLLPKKNGEHLSALWRKAAAAVGKESGKDASKLADELAALGKSLGVDGPLFGFTPDAPTRILGAAGQYDWHRRVAAFASELGDLLNAVSGILAADQAHSPEAHSADTLHAALGKEGSGDFDLDAFSSLLQTGKGGDGLPEARRRRIEQVLKDLKAGQKWFGGHPVMAEIADSCKGALALSRERESTFLAFFKAVHIARLEVANRYDAAGHDAFYQEFDRTALLPEERHLIPPVILSLSPEKLDAAETGALLEILNADLNIKVLLILDDFFGRPDGAKTFWQPGVAGKLASMAMNLNHAFVLQCPGANLDAMTRGFEDGIAFDGPALFAVFQPEAEERTALPAFLRSAAAGESRLMPAFTFHPGI
nr:hypothetical protein [Calditrichia bacterium]